MRILALDIGEKRVGIAVSDPDERIASPVAVLPAGEVRSGARPFRTLVEDWEPELLLFLLSEQHSSLIHEANSYRS